jgi:hypothetical protein
MGYLPMRRLVLEFVRICNWKHKPSTTTKRYKRVLSRLYFRAEPALADEEFAEMLEAAFAGAAGEDGVAVAGGGAAAGEVTPEDPEGVAD